MKEGLGEGGTGETYNQCPGKQGLRLHPNVALPQHFSSNAC